MNSVQLHQTRRGIMAHFAADQCIGQSLARYGEWAEDEIALLASYLPAGGTAVDVGANVGAHTLAFAEMVGSTGQVIAIEAQPATFALLCHNVIANGLIDRVIPLQVLAGHAAFLVDYVLKPASGNVGATTFVSEVRGDAQEGAGVRTKLALLTIDSLALQACHLIKIDVEGMEGDVIRGAHETLRAHRPVVYFEHANDEILSLSSAFSVLRSANYRLFWHNANPFNTRNYNGYRVNIFGGATELNVLALPEGSWTPNLPELTNPIQRPPRKSFAEGMSGVSV